MQIAKVKNGSGGGYEDGALVAWEGRVSGLVSVRTLFPIDGWNAGTRRADWVTNAQFDRNFEIVSNEVEL